MNAPAADQPPLRWMGIPEPTTVLTDLVLGVLAFVLAVRLGYEGASAGELVRIVLALGLMAAAMAAIAGAAAHAADPVRRAGARRRLWRVALHLIGLVGAAALAVVALFAARGQTRTIILWVALAKLVVCTLAILWRPEFRIAVVDYALSLAAVLIGGVYAYLAWRLPGALWLVGGVIVSFAGVVVQARRLAPHARFNHNDLYHVIQMVAVYTLFRGGLLVVDR